MIIDVYCERNGLEFLAEPLNAFSNASFLIAAWAAWRLAKRTAKLTLEIRILIALGTLVGIGSFLWHTYPTHTTLILDVVPIVIFIMWFIWLYTRKVIGMRSQHAVAAIILFLTATYFALPYSNFLHGAPVYTPGLLIVLVLGIYHALKKNESCLLLSTAGVYFTALFFRTIDQEICHFMTSGTHFIWHSLIGLVTYITMRALVLNFRPEDGSGHGWK